MSHCCRSICNKPVNWSSFDVNLLEFQRIVELSSECSLGNGNGGESERDEATIESDTHVLECILAEQKNSLPLALKFWRDWVDWRAGKLSLLSSPSFPFLIQVLPLCRRWCHSSE